jgi:hypothetical protein
MRISKSYASVAADTDGLANDVAPASGVAMALSATSAGDSLAHKVIITNNSATDYSGGGKTIVLVGVGYNGEAITETLTGPAGSVAVTSSNYYASLTSATPNFTRGTTDTFDIGWTAAAVTPPISILPHLKHGYFGMGISVDATGTPAYSLQQSYGGEWFAHATIATKTASADGSILFPVSAVRLIFTAASTVALNLVFPG